MVDDSENFFTTRWTRVARSRGDSEEAQVALAELCESYYMPVEAFIRATTKDKEAAADLTQAFFARILSGPAFASADPEKGRFRSFLLGAVKHFLYETYRNEQTQKRGRGQIHVALDPGTETSPGIDPVDETSLPPDAEFDRRWALTLLTRALAKLGEQFKAADNGKHFEVLKPWLTGDHAGLRQSEAATALGINENAVKVAIHRLRRRFRESVKSEVAQTLSDGQHVDEELKHLEAVLRK